MKLTEEMILARTKHRDLAEIKNFNYWGAGLTDVSVVSFMTNVEVLSLSVNQINTLRPFVNCKMLKELYIRKNQIQDLDEIVYLKDLTRLRSLWLGENPCSLRFDYRERVLMELPQLLKLDDIAVQNSVQSSPSDNKLQASAKISDHSQRDRTPPRSSPKHIESAHSGLRHNPAEVETFMDNHSFGINSSRDTLFSTTKKQQVSSENILSAITSLIAEMDICNLEKVDSIVKRRMEELRHGDS